MKASIVSFFTIYMLFVSAAFGQSQPCCDNIKIYGDANENTSTEIKHYDGFTYLTGTTTLNGSTYATFSKLDANLDVVWQYRFEEKSILFDFVKTDDNAFLLVGRENPVRTSTGAWRDNKSILARIDDNGGLDFIRIYDNNKREGFLNIIKHPNPTDPSRPYYMVGVFNSSSTPSSLDEVQIYQLDAQGNSITALDMDYANDDQFGRSLIALSNGDILMVGNYNDSPTDVTGILVRKAGDLSTVASVRTFGTNQTNFYDAVELSDGNILTVGGEGGNSANYNGLLSLVDRSLNALHTLSISNQQINHFTDVTMDENGNIFATAQTPNDIPVIFKLEVNAGSIEIVDAKYFYNNETAFTAAKLDATAGKLYYTDGRTDHPATLGAGSHDILKGYFSLDLSDACLLPLEVFPEDRPFETEAIRLNEEGFALPPADSTILLDLVYECMPICPKESCEISTPTSICNNNGTYQVSFQFINNTPNTITTLLVGTIPTGVNDLYSASGLSIPSNGTYTISFAVPLSGQQLCFRVRAFSEEESCCHIDACVEEPQCDSCVSVLESAVSCNADGTHNFTATLTSGVSPHLATHAVFTPVTAGVCLNGSSAALSLPLSPPLPGTSTISFTLDACGTPLAAGTIVEIALVLLDNQVDLDWCCHGDTLQIVIPDCPSLQPDCSCEELETDVKQGFAFERLQDDCSFRLAPKSLKACDEVQWFAKTTHLGSTTGQEAILYDAVPNAGNTIAMAVTRYQNDGRTCQYEIRQRNTCTTSVRPDSRIGLQPNPASTHIHISSQKEIIAYTILDMKGKPVRIEKLPDVANVIQNIAIHDLVGGLYLVQLQLADGTSAVHKFIKAIQ